MRHLLILLFVFGTCFSQEDNQINSEGNKEGLWKGYYKESKRLRFEGNFKNGKEVGLFKFFDDTQVGTIIATREFNDKDNSCYTIFYNQKKNKVSEGKLVNKLYVGEWKYYHENSDKIMTLEFYKEGKLDGVRKVYYPSGKIAEETSYKMGVKNGAYKKYAENGVLFEESNYLNGQFDGLATFRNVQNVIVSKGLFKKGKKSGIWEFNTNGKISRKDMDKPNDVKFVKREKPISLD